MKPLTDERMDQLVGGILRLGVLSATAIVVAGSVFYLSGHLAEKPHYGVFLAEPLALRTVRGTLRSAAHLDSSGLIQLGLLALVATPVARVAFSILGFAAQRDFLYVAITLAVMAVLCYSLFGTNL